EAELCGFPVSHTHSLLEPGPAQSVSDPPARWRPLDVLRDRGGSRPTAWGAGAGMGTAHRRCACSRVDAVCDMERPRALQGRGLHKKPCNLEYARLGESAWGSGLNG